jgi:hypothetical protein
VGDCEGEARVLPVPTAALDCPKCKGQARLASMVSDVRRVLRVRLYQCDECGKSGTRNQNNRTLCGQPPFAQSFKWMIAAGWRCENEIPSLSSVTRRQSPCFTTPRRSSAETASAVRRMR